MSNIHGLSSASKRDEKKADQEEFFGGGATSGTAVWRPTNGPQREANTNSGGGSGPDAMRELAAAARAQASSVDQSGIDRNIGLVTVYANGFILGNGEFRDAKDPRNAAFIASLKKGEVPAELEELCRREWGDEADAVRINLVDKSAESYTPPKPKFSFAQSKGQTIATAPATTDATAQFATILPRRVIVDPSQPTTTLQIVLADRRKLRETFNQSATVGDVFAHVAAVSTSQSTQFELVAGFPPKPLTNPAHTLKEAGLLGASVQQR